MSKLERKQRKAYRKLGHALTILARYRGYVPYESLRQIDDALTEWLGGYAWQDDSKIVRRIAPRVMRRLEEERYQEEQRQLEKAS